MGMNYHVTFVNAVIPAGSDLGSLAGDIDYWLDESGTDSYENVATRLPNGDVSLTGCSFNGYASYGQGVVLHSILRLCRPGAYIEAVDVEDGSGDRSRTYLLSDGTTTLVTPELLWPTVDINATS